MEPTQALMLEPEPEAYYQQQHLHGMADSPTVDSRDPLLQLPDTPSKSYMWLEDAISEWQTTHGRVTGGGSLRHGGYTPKQVGGGRLEV